MKKKKILINLSFTLIFAIIFFIAGITNFFEKWDLNLYDSLLHLKKDPPVSEKVIMGIIDEVDIDKLGDWPWTRNILADTLLRLKEFNTNSVVFDIEYISPSLKTLASNGENNILNQVEINQFQTQDLIRSVPKALERGYSISQLPAYIESLINNNLNQNYEELFDCINYNLSFDNDEYFAKACQFFGNTFLTVNNQDLGYSSITQDDIYYIFNRFLDYKVQDPNKYILKDNDYTFKETYDGIGKGFTPALHLMMEKAAGAGFTNSNVDSDGTRRRMELLYEYDDHYLPQLVFAPLLKILDVKEIIRNKNQLILKDSLYPGETQRQDVVIPLDSHGAMLINWQHETSSNEEKFYGINYEHIYTINQLDLIEQNIFDNLNILLNGYILLDKGYPLDYFIEASQLVDQYKSILEYKDFLLSQCTGFDINGNPYDGFSSDLLIDYYSLRKDFFNNVENFIKSNHLNTIIEFLTINNSLDEEFIQDISDIFDILSEDFYFYTDLFNSLKQKFDNAYCLIGMTAASTTDIGAIPFIKQYSNIGIHANLMNTIITKSFIKEISWFWGFLISIIVSVLGLLIIEKSNTFQNLVNGFAKIILILLSISIFVFGDIYMPMFAGVILFNLLDYLAGLLRRYLASSKEKKFITQIASSFANKDTVDELRKNPEAFKTEGQKKYITALFSDIQKFSTFSERISKIYKNEGPNKLIEILNEYLGSMSNEILVNNGNIDKYEGDAIISMFGAPDPLNSHTKEEWAYLCLSSAIKMKKREIEFNNAHKNIFRDYEIINENGQTEKITLDPLQTRIGINSGEAFVGLMGSKTEFFSKLNYTMIGDTVNLASRLEGVNKVYNTWIICSEDTWNFANSGQNQDKIVVRPLDKVRVVGRSTPVQLYNVIGFKDEVSDSLLHNLDLFNQGLSLYLNKDFEKAKQIFMECNKKYGDFSAQSFYERCSLYLKKGVPDNWDGVMNMTSK